MPEIDTFNRWLIGSAHGGRCVKILAPPTAYDELTPEEATVMAAHLIVAARVDHARLCAAINAVAAS